MATKKALKIVEKNGAQFIVMRKAVRKQVGDRAGGR